MRRATIVVIAGAVVAAAGLTLGAMTVMAGEAARHHSRLAIASAMVLAGLVLATVGVVSRGRQRRAEELDEFDDLDDVDEFENDEIESWPEHSWPQIIVRRHGRPRPPARIRTTLAPPVTTLPPPVPPAALAPMNTGEEEQPQAWDHWVPNNVVNLTRQ